MTSARTIRKNHKSRTFVTKRCEYESGEVIGPWWFYHRYGDVRSHQKRRHVPSNIGTLDTSTGPGDAALAWHKAWKDERAKDIRDNKKRLHKLKQFTGHRKHLRLPWGNYKTSPTVPDIRAVDLWASFKPGSVFPAS